MKKLTVLAASLVILSTTGCTNIHFDNGEYTASETANKTKQWHHNFGLGLYEGSDAINLSQTCADGQWQSVHTYKSFVNGLAEMAVNEVGPVWYPKTVEVDCVKVPYKVQ
ncbi:hypothetical protein [Pseudoalteromonas sp. S1608]|uniref:Bor/Iss family lipoprotein n=1 Tax=Pseudoalteromonas sp. S1608 TaxID=579504 RepID=UPI00110B2994|nr:hypothetical protein [Pseudoalteromonas sp. S1608]TMP74080.1 hypothetical protein CWB75_11465 [Pseudoalteromonas sp. S1608]